MTREEEIIGAASKYSEYEFNECAANNGFIKGAQWADNHPKSPWISVKDKLPPEGEEVLAFNKKWIDEDFNPNGTRIGFLNGDGEFTSAYWWNYQDSYITINKSICEDDKDFYENHIDNTEPEYWMPIPKSPKE